MKIFKASFVSILMAHNYNVPIGPIYYIFIKVVLNDVTCSALVVIESGKIIIVATNWN